MDVEIFCERLGCGHHAPVNLEALEAAHGDDDSVAGFLARSGCCRCGARHPEITIRVSPNGNPRVIRLTVQAANRTSEQ
jgi:hypothetical protein